MLSFFFSNIRSTQFDQSSPVKPISDFRGITLSVTKVGQRTEILESNIGYMKFVQLWSCFAFISPKFRQLLIYFAKWCDCMISAFRNSGCQCHFSMSCPYCSPSAPSWCHARLGGVRREDARSRVESGASDSATIPLTQHPIHIASYIPKTRL